MTDLIESYKRALTSGISFDAPIVEVTDVKAAAISSGDNSGNSSGGDTMSNNEPVYSDDLDSHLYEMDNSFVDNEVIAKYEGKYNQLIAQPLPGSVLAFSNKPNVRKADIERMLAEKYWKQLGLNLLDPHVSKWVYGVYALVLPHNSALNLAEESKKYLSAHSDMTEFDLLSKLTGYRVVSESDVTNVIRAILRRNNKLSDIALSAMGWK